MIIAPNSTDISTYFKLVNPTTGVPVTGLTITDLDATYIRDRAAAVKADLTALVAVDSAHGDNKAIQIDATNAPGLYRVDWPDAAFAAGVGRVQLVVNGAAIDPAVIEVELAPWLTAITGATVLADLRSILGTALTETVGGYLAAAFKKFFDKASPTGTVNSLPDAVAGAASGVAIVGSAMTLTGAYDAAKAAAQAGALTTHDGKLDTVDANIDTLIARLTALRAGYLDNLSAGAVAQASALATVLAAVLALPSLGSGTTPLVVTATDGATPLDGVEVDVTTTSAHANPVATGVSDAFGKVTFHLDPGTYYVWVQHARYNATNPTTVVVP
jgi:hypothetical protein